MSSGPFRRAEDDEVLEPHGADSARLDIVRGDQVKPEAVRWLWRGWLAAGRLHILAGPPGLGKSSIMLALAATISSGGRRPDGTSAERGNVILLSYEDDPADTLVPRLQAMGADMTRVHILKGVLDADGRRGFNAAEDARLLVEEVARIGNVKLIGIDPVIVALGVFDSHKNAETRQALQPIADLAAQTGAAVLGVAHFSKGTAGREPLERVSGSLGFGAAPRLVLGVAKVRDKSGEEQRLLLRLKSNIGPDGGGFRYEVEPASLIGGMETCRLVWGQAVDGSPLELLATEGGAPSEYSELDEAKEFLRALLADGPVSSKQIRRDTEGANHAWITVRRAAKALGIEHQKAGLNAGCTWRLPTKLLNEPEVAHQKSMSTFGVDEHLQGPESASKAAEAEEAL